MKLPTDPVGRIHAAGVALFGRGYRAKLAAALNIGRTTLYEYQTGAAPVPTDMDRRLATAIQSELLHRERQNGPLIEMISQLLTVVRVHP